MDTQAASSLGRAPARAALLALAAISACDVAGPPAPALADVGALRAKVSACLGVDAPAAFTFFWPEHLGGAAGAGACVSGARDCTDVLACAGYSGARCKAADDRCEGDTAVACLTLTSGLEVELRRDCPGDPTGNNVCSVADDLKYGRGAFCHAASCAAEHCDGSVVVRCRGGFEVRSDCRAEGKTCIEADGQAFCALDASCEADRCVGDTIEICGSGRITLRERCDEVIPGTTCTDQMGRVECSAPVPSPGCLGESDFASWCDGGLAFTCIAGVRAEVDCAALPGGACQARLEDGRSRASCTAAEPF